MCAELDRGMRVFLVEVICYWSCAVLKMASGMPFEVKRVALACDPEKLLTANEVETPALSYQGPVEGVKKLHGWLVDFVVWEAVDSFEDGVGVLA